METVLRHDDKGKKKRRGNVKATIYTQSDGTWKLPAVGAITISRKLLSI